jgi:hypothetical protein
VEIRRKKKISKEIGVSDRSQKYSTTPVTDTNAGSGISWVYTVESVGK